MLYALKAGASCVIPCLEIDESKQIAARMPDQVVLGGERRGVKIPGFDLGNSPAEYVPEIVAGKTVVMTTTNGTRALQACGSAARVLIGAFANFSRVVSDVFTADKVSLLCAGTNGHITAEDVLFAGAIVDELMGDPRARVELNDEAHLARAAWQELVGKPDNSDRLVVAMQQSRGGRNLMELGFEDDIRDAARVDAAPIRGELRWSDRRIVGA
jgi:2-phosphosulfolactate phosphatase